MKLSGIKIGEYELVDKRDEDDSYEYEEITIDELLNRNNYSDEDRRIFLNKYFAINIHQLLAAETYDSCFKLIDDIQNDDRLSGLNAVVFLMLKSKGDRNKFHAIESIEQFSKLINTTQEAGVRVGMDSCTAPLMLQHSLAFDQRNIIPSIEPCESTLFSIYINVDAQVFPCSFAEGTKEWEQGIDIISLEDFYRDIWFSGKLSNWRDKLINSSKSCVGCSVQQYCRSCPEFDITHCRKE